jgi:outer membrane assembly lipoprotein YfgL
MKSLGVFCLVGLLSLLSACSSVDKPKPTALGANPELLGVRKAWSANIGEVSFPLRVVGVGSEVALASSNGTIAVLDARTGQDVWRTSLGENLSAGVGFDGKRLAVATQANSLVVFDGGKELWRSSLGTSVVTAPLVAGGRIFVLGGDRTVSAFDGVTGRVLWQQQRSADALVLRQPGLLTAVGDTLVVGVGGRLVGVNPLTGALRWDLVVANSRGSNEVEKLIEIPAGVAREGQQLCVRAYQHSVACIDTAKPVLQWSKVSAGFTGLAGDADAVFGVDAQGVVSAYRRSMGDSIWTSNYLRYRQLTAPSVVGRSVVVGDADGNVHLLSKADGSLLTRLPTDGSPIAAVPTLSAQALVVVTQRGGVFGFKPE